jgi:aldehyde:ferredoxin oxidoreductase
LFGYAGNFSRVNLTTGEIKNEPLSEATARKYLGGRGFASRILYDELLKGADPLGPGNKIVVSTGLLTGTPAPAGNRTAIAARSPLTGVWGDATYGGNFGGELKRAGFDALIIEGVSKKPVYLWISDGQAELRDATALWGQETGPAQQTILNDVGKAAVLGIGPGGENMVRYASALSELRFSASRSGMGAVMGSKKLKAIAVRGTNRVAVAEPKELTAFTRQIYKEIRANKSCATLTELGTWNNMSPLLSYGILPAKNFRQGAIEGGEKLTGAAVVKSILTRRETCPNCPIFCRRVVVMEKPYKLSGIYGGPQYETVAALGSLLMITDPRDIAKAHELCNRYTVDTMSAGECIAWAMECWERGIDLGRPLVWGNVETVFELIEEIAYRRGIGALLADGVRKAAARVGQGSEAWALHVKGLEMAMHDPRGKKGMGLNYATGNRGACHLQILHEDALEAGGPYPELKLDKKMSRLQFEGKPYMVKITQDYFGTLGDSLGLCKFPLNAWRPFTPTRLAQAVAMVTGWDVTLEELLTSGERIYNLCRMFNVREGISRKDDTLPSRIGEPLKEGASAGHTVNREQLSSMLDEYYYLRGWDENGIPRAETLKRLGLESNV